MGEGGLSVCIDGLPGSRQLFLGDIEFPWLITEDGIAIKSTRTSYTSVELSFFAKDVDTDEYIIDAREFYDINGNLWANERH